MFDNQKQSLLPNGETGVPYSLAIPHLQTVFIPEYHTGASAFKGISLAKVVHMKAISEFVSLIPAATSTPFRQGVRGRASRSG